MDKPQGPETQLTATLPAAQWDVIGRHLANVLQQHQAEVNSVTPILNSLRAQLQPKPGALVQPNGQPLKSVQDLPEVVPEPEMSA